MVNECAEIIEYLTWNCINLREKILRKEIDIVVIIASHSLVSKIIFINN